jgi:hypothetical protein
MAQQGRRCSRRLGVAIGGHVRRGVIRLELLYFPHDSSAAAFKIVLHGPTVD